ncbi:TcaA NTF2-like domain-containing protein [Saccharibacillus deserti]|uniref:TcaA NTF2-like domain-containing protein n=1 Tax=Saccharibacillus deserti TaxID=1634444 RepID=UPI001FEBF787|nr:hypothetical protein [Saccharibacillus deserti]
MSKKTKILAGSLGGVVLLLAAAYLILRMTYGPSTPDELAKKLNVALDAKDTAAFSAYLDDPNSPLLAADRLQTFKTSLEDEDVRRNYKEGILNAIQLAETAKKSGDDDSFSSRLKQELETSDAELSPYWITFAEERSWRGSRWSAHVVPVSIAARSSDSAEEAKSSIKIGELKAEDGMLKNLWPSSYTYSGALTGLYGSQEYDGRVEAYQYPQPVDVVFDVSKTNALTLRFPSVNTKVTLNGKEVTGTPGEYTTFRPVPQKIELTASTDAYGVALSGKATVDAAQDTDYEVGTMLQQAASEQAADLFFKTMTSWVKATNAGSPALLTGYDPQGRFGEYLTWEMENDPDSRYALGRVFVNPANIRFEQDYLTVDAGYVYADSDYLDEERSDAIRLEIAPQSGKKSWWITGYSSAYVEETDQDIKRENAEFKKESSALYAAAKKADAPSSTEIGSTPVDASASGSAAFTQEDAQSFMNDYLTSSVDAINNRDFSYAAPYMDPDGPAAKESSDYIPYLESKGITEAFEGAVVNEFKDNGDSTYTVHTRESYIIYNKDMEGTARSFDSVYTLSVIDGMLKAHKLVSTEEVE